MKSRKESFFWTSYSDLMTSLFFIMMVLFVLVIVLLHNKVQATERQLQDIKEVVNSTRDLKGRYFSYREDYKKYILNVQCRFPVNGYDISLLSEDTKAQLLQAGKEVDDFLMRHHTTKYLVIIEGQASRNTEKWMLYNYELSYKRALSLRLFWSKHNVNFGSNCELQIAASGDGRLNASTMRERSEHANQRFLIYIIPKNIINE